nr:uncharacterized protein LOC117274164 [Nicotiana tomentosiformis]
MEHSGFLVETYNGRGVALMAKSSLVEFSKATQYKDERLRKYRDEALAGKSKDMIVESDGILRMGNMLCVADVDGLRQAILEEAHNSRYTIHPGSTKNQIKAKHQRPAGLLQQIEIPELKTTYGEVRYAQIFMNEIVRLYGVPTDGQSECTIQILEDILRACILELGGSWDAYLPLVEFGYNNSFHSSIQMALCEALYGRRCRSPVGSLEAGETNLLGPDLVQEAIDKVQLISHRLLTAQSTQKSYADKRRRYLMLTIGDKVFLRVSPMKDVM